MTKLTLLYVQAFKDRHGRKRHYFRRPGFKRVPLPGLPGSDEFQAAYAAALAGETAPARQVGADRTKRGSFSALIVAYYQSAEFKGLRASTQRTYRNHIESFRLEHGDRPVALVEGKHIRAILDKKAATPAAANNLLKRIRTLMQFAIERGWRKDDPSIGVKKVRSKSKGYATWTEAEIELFEGKWAPGTKPRLALALLLYTGQRRSDVVTMGRQHIRGDKIYVKQLKTDTELLIPLHPALRAEIDLQPAEHLTFVMTEYGKPFSAPGFSNWFVDRCRDAGLPVGRSPHGLRKSAARRLAEAGCSAHEIAAITGHRSLSEVERYTRAADQSRMAESAMAALSPARPPKRS